MYCTEIQVTPKMRVISSGYCHISKRGQFYRTTLYMLWPCGRLTVCLSICLSVASHCSIKTAKHTITQNNALGWPGTPVFWCHLAKFQWGLHRRGHKIQVRWVKIGVRVSQIGSIRNRNSNHYIPDHFQNLFNSSLFHNLPVPQISWKSAHNLLSYSTNKQTDTYR